MEVFFILSTSGTAVRKALAGIDGFEIVNGIVLSLSMVWCTLEPFVG